MVMRVLKIDTSSLRGWPVAAVDVFPSAAVGVGHYVHGRWVYL